MVPNPKTPTRLQCESKSDSFGGGVRDQSPRAPRPPPVRGPIIQIASFQIRTTSQQDRHSHTDISDIFIAFRAANLFFLSASCQRMRTAAGVDSSSSVLPPASLHSPLLFVVLTLYLYCTHRYYTSSLFLHPAANNPIGAIGLGLHPHEGLKNLKFTVSIIIV